MEIWKDIPGFEGIYQCSTEGRIKSYDRFVNAKLNSKKQIKGKLIKPSTTKRGYNIVALSQDNSKSWRLVSRIVYETFNGSTHLQVDHINEIKTDNRLSNLQPLSNYDNVIKSKRHNKTSKYPGVCLYPSGKWRAQIGIKGKKIALGYYMNEDDAYAAYLKARPI